MKLSNGRAIIDSRMAPSKMMLTQFPWSEQYRVSDVSEILTPALLIYPEIVASNIKSTLSLLGGKADRWRAHVKTAKLGYSMRCLIDNGVRCFKCATTLELLVACESGAKDVLVAYPVVGANAKRVREIAALFPAVQISVLAENEDQVHQWRGSSISIFLDINPGMNRTGIDQDNHSAVLALIRAIGNSRLEFRGLHYYDGHYGSLPEPERTAAAHDGYRKLLRLITELQKSGVEVSELITAGTPTFPCSLSFEGFANGGFIHRISPGTIVYNDAASLAQLPPQFGYAPAALVLSRVVSHPSESIITCDAGHKSVSADAGLPTCIAIGHAELEGQSPSEEHLPMHFSSAAPAVGEELFLLPRHVCPTVNNFDSAVLVRNGKIESVERVTARGREFPLLSPERVDLLR